MPTFDVRFSPASTGSTDLDDEGFVSGADVLNFSVTSDTPGLSATAVRQFIQSTGQVPREGTSHPTSALSFARSVSLNQVGPIYYEGTISYRAVPRPASENDENTLPWDQPARFEFAGITTEVPADEDADGNAIVNPGTNEPVDGITRPVTDFGIVITKNIIGVNPLSIQQFSNKVNSDTFLLFSPGLCRTGDIKASPQSYETLTYYSVVVPIVVREIYGSTTAEEAWYHRRRLQGFYEVQTINGVDSVVRSLDDEGQPVTTPVLLDATGRRLPAGDPPVFEGTKRHQTAVFAGFGIL